MGAEEPEQAEETQLRKLWKTHPSNSSTGTALIDKANQWPLSAGRAQRGPCGQRHLAFSAQLRGMAGGHQLSPCFQPVLGGLSSGRAQEAGRESQQLPLGPRRLRSKRTKERNWSLKPSSFPPSLPTWDFLEVGGGETRHTQ